jgi:hypothetical protein
VLLGMSNRITTYTSISPLSPTDRVAYEQWLDQIVDLSEAAKLRGGVHVATLKRAPATKDKIIRLSARRVGMRRRHALMLE